MITKRIAYIVSAALAAAVLTGCNETPESDHEGGNDPIPEVNSTLNIEELFPELVASTTSSEEERTHFDTVWDMFDYKDDKSEIEFMSFEADNGIQKLSISSFEEKLTKYGKKAEIRSDGGLYAFDASGAAVAAVPGDDGSVDYQLCDGAVLGAALENKYMQILRSKSACFGMHLGTSAELLEIQIPGIEKVESDIGQAGKYVLERDDYRFTAYTNGGQCFWFILTVFDNNDSESAASGTEATSSSLRSPVIWEQPQQQEKIPLTDEEESKLGFGPTTINFFAGYAKANQKYDLTNSIDTIDKLNFILSKLTVVAKKEEADDSEFFEGDFRDWTVYYYKPETVEKLIRKYFLPSFKIESIDYTKSAYWNPENGRFEVEEDFDAFEGISKEYYYIHEDAYKAGDYYYLYAVPLADYPNAEQVYIDRRLSNFSSDYFDIPRVKLKFKKFYLGEYYGEQVYNYVCVGCEPVDKRPDWLECAAKLFKDNDLANVEMIGKAPVQDSGLDMTLKRTAGVINTPFGKRLYLYEKKVHMGNLQFAYKHDITTFGTRGKDDRIVYSMDVFTSQGGNLNAFSNISDETLTCNDVFSNEKYTHFLQEGEETTYENGKTVNIKDIHKESWKLNDEDISENKFNSAEVVSYFLNTFKGYGLSEQYEFDSLYSCEVENGITLAVYYEMCHIMTD